MRQRNCAVVLIAIMLFGQANATRGQEVAKPKLSQSLTQILNWLPEDSETLIVANGPFQIPQERTEANYDRPFLETVRFLSFSLMEQLRKGFLQKLLKGQNVLIAVEASRRFTSPKLLGLMPFEGCQILKFDVAAHDVVQAAVASCFEKADKTIEIAGTKVAVFTEKWESDEWTVLVAQPERGVLLCASNQKFLEQVLARRKQANPSRAFPDDLPEWRHVKADAPVWCMRHFSKDFIATDPTSPFKAQAAANVPDLKAIGFVFWFDPKTEPAAKVRYLSMTDVAKHIATRAWNDPTYGLVSTVNEVEPGVIEVTSSITDKKDSGGMFAFVLMMYLGHAGFI